MQFLPFVYAGVPMSFPPPCYFVVPVQFPAVFPPPFFMPPMVQRPLVQQPLVQRPMVQRRMVQTFRAHMPLPIVRLALPEALTALEQAQQTAEKCAMWVLE